MVLYGLTAHMLEENAIRCKPPLETDEVAKIVASITRGQQAITRADMPDRRQRILWNHSHYMDTEGRSCYTTLDQMEEDLGWIAGKPSVSI